MNVFIATYDISNDKRRQRVARILMPMGFRLQYSVFQVTVDDHDIDELQRKVGPLLDPSDYFDLIPVDRDPRRSRLSWMGHNHFASVLVIE